MQDEDLDFRREGMALLSRLAKSGRNTDRQITRHFFPVLNESIGWERKNIGGLVLAAELAIELAELRIICEQNRDLTSYTQGGLRFRKKAVECAERGKARTTVRGGRARGRWSAQREIWPDNWVEKDHRARSYPQRQA